MRKCKMIVTVKECNNEYLLYNLLVINKQGDVISLIQENSNPQVYESRQAVMRLAKAYGISNGYKVDSFKQFGALWYDIDFINIDTGHIERYPYMIINER